MVHIRDVYRSSFDLFTKLFSATLQKIANAVPGGLTTISNAAGSFTVGAGGKEAKDRRMGLLVNLVEDVTAAVHGRVCASFFSEHRLLFTAMFSMQLQLYNGSAVFSAAEMH